MYKPSPLAGRKATSPMELRVEDGKVEMIFKQQTKWIKLTADQAEAIGQKLLEFSRTARGNIIITGIDAIH